MATSTPEAFWVVQLSVTDVVPGHGAGLGDAPKSTMTAFGGRGVVVVVGGTVVVVVVVEDVVVVVDVDVVVVDELVARQWDQRRVGAGQQRELHEELGTYVAGMRNRLAQPASQPVAAAPGDAKHRPVGALIAGLGARRLHQAVAA